MSNAARPRSKVISITVTLSLALAGALGCEPGEVGDPPALAGDDETPSAVYAEESGSTCIGPNGYDLPPMTIQDVLYVLQNLVPYYSANPGELFTGPFTNWYKDPDIRVGLAKLAVMRGILDKFNLYDMYLSPLAAPGCSIETVTNRTIDGSCNNLAKPGQGAVGVRFGRNMPPILPNGDGTFRKNPVANPDPATFMSPNPRDVSRKLLKRTSFKPVGGLNMLAAAWIQFQVHDWFSHGENSKTTFYDVPLATDDELRKRYGLKSLKIAASASDATRTPLENALLPPSYQNEVTHWWDGSQIYGSDKATADRLRTFEGGHLRIDDDGLLPAAADGFEDTGFRRNWWLGLALMHNLFAQEHNAIADMLHEAYPEMTDEELYQKARMINAAVIAKIHTVEWTPAILPNQTLDIGMNANWQGLNSMFGLGLPVPPPEQRTGPADAVLYGVVGGNRDDKGVPFTLTEEFVSVYRMHPLLPDAIEVRSPHDGELITKISTEKTQRSGARGFEEQYGLETLLYSAGVQHPGALVLGNYPKFLQELNIPFVGVMDMGTIDILRDRERGIPRYNAFRQQLRLKKLSSLEELTTDPVLLANLKSVYGSDAGAIDRVDLLVGTLAEANRPTCYGFGETLFQVFTLMATRRLQADRFYTNDFRPEVYTPEGMAWIQAATLKSVLLRHYPDLADTGLANVDNAFYPWE
jgi:hypothetical protein